MTDEKRDQIRDGWQLRQKQHGDGPRSVLMKGVHPLINESIDRWHRDVLSAVFENAHIPQGSRILDVGCGFGRLAGEISRLGLVPVGVDFTPMFCASFSEKHGNGVCGDQSALPFRDSAFGGAYSVTSLMYLDAAGVQTALAELDRCVTTGGTILFLEPCREFNELVRMMLPRKRGERLAMPGFTLDQVRENLLPATWQPIAAGHCRWLTLALPLLAMATRWPWGYRRIAALVRHLDRPRNGVSRASGRLALYRWVACRKT